MTTGQMARTGELQGALGAMCRAHDLATRLTYQLAVLALAVIVVAYCYEVVARYAFNAPTIWANPIASYLMCATIFLALPELTRTAQHISINILIDALPKTAAMYAAQLVRLIGLGSCLAAAWITGIETRDQMVGSIQTISFLPIPKWIVSVLIPYGLLSAGLYFLRQIAGERPPAAAGGGLP